jgi:hypothetical protein
MTAEISLMAGTILRRNSKVAMAGRLVCLVLAAGLSSLACAAPPNMSLADYLAKKKQISAEHRSAQVACDVNPSTSREICLAEAIGRDEVAKADLEVAYRSTPRTRYEANEARANARFWVAREQCGDAARPVQDACLRDAKTARLAAQTSATVLMKSAEADTATDEACADAARIGHQRTRACVLRAADLRSSQGQTTK